MIVKLPKTSSRRAAAAADRLARVEAAAADWLVRRRAGIPADEEARFQAWLGSDPRHVAAFLPLERIWEELEHPRKHGQAEGVRQALRARARRRARRRRTWWVGTAGLAAVVALALQLNPGFLPVPTPTPASVLGAGAPTFQLRPDLRTLADGSTVELNAGAEISVEFSPEQRGVRLVRGEALFHVAKNPARPFVVTAAGVEVRAVGTAFSVRHTPDRVDVLVTEGRVAVARRAAASDALAFAGAADRPAPGPALVAAGERTSIPLLAESAPASSAMSSAELTAALAWRAKRVEFSGTPLGEAVQVFDRLSRLRLVIDDPAVRRLRVTGVVWLDDPEAFVRLLEAGLGLEGRRKGDTIVLRQPPADR